MIPSPHTLPTTAPAMAPAFIVDDDAVADDVGVEDAEVVADPIAGIDAVAEALGFVHMSIEYQTHDVL